MILAVPDCMLARIYNLWTVGAHLFPGKSSSQFSGWLKAKCMLESKELYLQKDTNQSSKLASVIFQRQCFAALIWLAPVATDHPCGMPSTINFFEFSKNVLSLGQLNL